MQDYDYDLPERLIAQSPLAERDASRLLVLRSDGGPLEHRAFRDLPEYLEPGDLLVLNETRVLPARLRARRAGGGKAELLLVRPEAEGRWLALLRPSVRVRPGAALSILDASGREAGSVTVGETAGEGLRRIEFGSTDVPALLERAGAVPLPPYIRRPAEEADRASYQTIYGRVPGAVAAPTAGLHFTERVFAALAERGVETAKLTLHVGPGTFRPVTVENPAEHRLEAEWCEIPAETASVIERTRSAGRRVVAVGTTTTRSLEAAARAGDGTVGAYRGWVDLFIHPPFEFRVVNALVTNFHLPRSSLLLLVCAFAGRERVLAAYAEAVRERYRFYSYGDAMLIL